MNYKKQVEDLIRNLSLEIVKYEDGDLFLISDLIEDIGRLQDILSSIAPALQISRILTAALRRRLQNRNMTELQEILEKGMDLISRLTAGIDYTSFPACTTGKLLEQDINAFTEHYRALAEPETDTGKHQQAAGGREQAGTVSNPEVLKIFSAEAEEKAVAAQDLLLRLEAEPHNESILQELFRLFHTIKGECGFLQLHTLGELAHNLENLLDRLRHHELATDAGIIDILLTGTDYILQLVHNGGTEPAAGSGSTGLEEFYKRTAACSSDVRPSIGEILSREGKLTREEVDGILKKQKESNFTKKFGEIAVEEKYISAKDFHEVLKEQSGAGGTTPGTYENSDPVIKVRASRINYLVDMIGELLIAENQLDDAEKNVVQLKKITRTIQYAAMQLRTVKIRNLFINMKRAARDIARKTGREVNIVTAGDDLEIDRNLVEILSEPLIHIIRNCLSHGIENPEERIRKQKNRQGEIILKAERRGNHVVISARDDGRGLNRERILQKAAAAGLVSPDQAATLTEQEIFSLIFLPGFSTAEQVDNVSGRGVGMDVVRSVVTASRGRVEIKSRPDIFTEIELIFPLSMAIIDGMIIRIADTYFVIPVSSIVESLQVPAEMLFSVTGKARVLDLRGQVIPVIRLTDFFYPGREAAPEPAGVIIESKNKHYALLVHEIIAKKEVVIKPLDNKFRNLRGISAGTILPGGRIGFILDVEKVVCA